MIIDYEGAPVHDCMYKGDYYIVKKVDISTDITTIERSSTIIGTKTELQTVEVAFDELKKENDHFMFILKKGRL